MKNKRIRFGILGCADIAKRRFIPALIKSDCAEFVGIASRSKGRAMEVAGKYKVKAYSYESLIKSDNIDAVYIPLPNSLHFDWSLRALKEGKHVLCEKPIVLDLKSAYILVKTAEKYKKSIMEGYMFLYHPQHLKIKELIKKGVIGKPRLFRSSFGFLLEDKKNFRLKKGTGGDALLETGGYPLAAIRFFFNNKVQNAAGFSQYNCDGVEINYKAIIKLKNGINAEIGGGYNQAYECFYQLIGTKGIITLDRCYTTPADMRNVIKLKIGSKEYNVRLTSSDHFLNMIDYFCKSIKYSKIRDVLRKDILSQIQLVDYIRSNLKVLK